MKKLYDDMVKGLQKQGYKLQGGGNFFAILTKGKKTVKVFGHNPTLRELKQPTHVIVRYS